MATLFDSSVHLFSVNNDNDVVNQKEYASIIDSLSRLLLVPAAAAPAAAEPAGRGRAAALAVGRPAGRAGAGSKPG